MEKNPLNSNSTGSYSNIDIEYTAAAVGGGGRAAAVAASVSTSSKAPQSPAENSNITTGSDNLPNIYGIVSPLNAIKPTSVEISNKFINNCNIYATIAFPSVTPPVISNNTGNRAYSSLSPLNYPELSPTSMLPAVNDDDNDNDNDNDNGDINATSHDGRNHVYSPAVQSKETDSQQQLPLNMVWKMLHELAAVADNEVTNAVTVGTSMEHQNCGKYITYFFSSYSSIPSQNSLNVLLFFICKTNNYMMTLLKPLFEHIQ